MKYFVLFIILTSCAGYRYRNKENPFIQFGIRTLSVPMFYNHSSLHNVSGVFTKEIFNTMINYKGLELRSGNAPADAVLIGIVESAPKLNETVSSEAFKSVINSYGEDVFNEKRKNFNLPSVNRVSLSVRIIVIKQPSKEEIQFLKTSYGKGVISSKIIFNEVISLSGNYNLKENEGQGIKVLGTQNRGIQQATVKDLALNAATSFKDMILYAF
jgi:hypothetical protein